MNDQPDHNLQRLLNGALRPQPMQDDQIEELLRADDAAFVSDEQLGRIASGARKLIAGQKELAAQSVDAQRVCGDRIVLRQLPVVSSNGNSRRGAVAAVVVAAMSLLVVLFGAAEESERRAALVVQQKTEKARSLASIRSRWMTASTAGHATPMAAVNSERIAVGDAIETGERERRRLHLPDGSVLYVNESASVKVESPRRIKVTRGEVFVEVVPQFDSHERRELFEIVTPTRTITALGTKFGVNVEEADAEVLVTQGKVQVQGVSDPVEAGQRLEMKRRTENGKPTATPSVTTALRASTHLAWTRDLMVAAVGALVPTSEYAGGAIITVDPNGQKTKLSLRRYHVDVHIEDGFARTTIDQTYFNHTQSRLEGTFHFPLPSDASLSRLAMYVNGKLMEGGMAEREHARNTFETIVHKMKDPALLEWVDGSTFKMRVFPLEARQEKRIVLSYTQRLNSAYGKTEYRFPAGHSMDVVGKWSTHVLVKNGAEAEWHSTSHDLAAQVDDDDLLLTADEGNSRMDRDLVVELNSADPDGVRGVQSATPDWSRARHDDHQYLMLRFRPELPGEMHRKPRHWVFLIEASADRNPLLARTQIEIIRTLLKNAEHSDTFNIVTANTEAIAFSRKPLKCTTQNITNALSTLEQTHLIGALDLQKAFQKCTELAHSEFETVVVHTGSAIPVLGERDQQALLQSLPDRAGYVGVGVGKRWSRPFMKAAAGESGGYFVQINPDEDVAWKAFELSSVLNAPRLLDVKVKPKAKGEKRQVVGEFLTFADTIAQGEEICAIARFGADEKLPASVIVNGMLNGKPWKQTVKVKRVGDKAEYLPRTWAKLQIDRLLADGATEHKNEIVRLSKSMYVMSPFTSLLVLENEEMYTQHNIDRGRKDHWALYPCPEEIAVVHEPVDASNLAITPSVNSDDLLSTIRLLPAPYSVWRSPAVGQRRSALSPRYRELATQPTIENLWRGRRDLGLSAGDYYYVPNDPSETLDDLIQFNVNVAGNAQRLNFRNDRRFEQWNRPEFRGSNGSGLGLRGDVSVEQIDELELLILKGTSNHVQRVEQIVRQLEERNRSLEDGLGELQPVELRHAVPDLNSLFFNWQASQYAPYSVNSFQQSSPVQPFYTIRGPSDFGINSDAYFDYRPWTDTKGDNDVRFGDSPLMWYGRTEGFEFGLPQLQQSQRPQVTAVDGPGQNHWGFIGPFYPNQGVPLAWRQMPLSWDDGAWDPDFSRPTDSVWLDPVLPSGFLFGERGAEATLSDFDALSIAPLRWHRSPSVLPLAMYLDDGTPYFPAGSDLQLANQIEVAREYLRQQRRMGELPSTAWHNDSGFHDLLAHAPGLNTWHADVLALQKSDTPSYIVDDAARLLIERARSLGWERVAFPKSEGEDVWSVLCDGTGRHSYARVVSEGLREEVFCDGKSLVHSYPELGLAAGREFSRFHRRGIDSLVPWLLPSADELAFSGDVLLLDERTVAVRGKRTELQLVFGEEGRLAERRLVLRRPKQDRLQSTGEDRLSSKDAAPVDESKNSEATAVPTSRLVWRMVFDSDGTVRLLDGAGNELSVVKLKRHAAPEPELKIDEEKIVVLPMPIRSSKCLLDQAEEQAGDSAENRRQDLRLILAYMAEGNGAEVAKRIHEHFLSRGDKRDGFYVLLSRFPGNLVWEEDVEGFEGRKREVDLRPSPEGSPLRQFVLQYINAMRQGGDRPAEFDIDGSEDGFIQRLATAQNIFGKWDSGKATDGRTEAQIRVALGADLKFIDTCQSDSLAWTLLSVIQPRIEAAELNELLAEAAQRFEDNPQLAIVARQERVRALFKAGRTRKARRLYSEMLLAAARDSAVPRITAELRESYRDNDSAEAWEQLTADCGEVLTKSGRLRAALAFSIQLRYLGDSKQAGQILDDVLSLANADTRPDVLLFAVEQLRQLKNGKAHQLVETLLQQPSLRKDAGLWRYAAHVANSLGHKQAALERLEQALLLEFEHRPDVVNVEVLRADYADLMTRYGAVIDAATTLETNVPDDLYARIIRAADQWRSLDDDATQCCQTAARLLSKLNRKSLAWAYLTTPLADSSGESAPWRTLAEHLTSQNEVDLADMAWAKAFEFEQTNPEILLAHAKMLQANGRYLASQRLLQQVVNSNWQPRFERVRREATALLP